MRKYINLGPKFLIHIGIVIFLYILSFIYFNYSSKTKHFIAGVVHAITFDADSTDLKIAKIINWVHANNHLVGYKNYKKNLSYAERFNPLIGLVKKSSLQVMFEGGECGNLARLTVNMLNEINVKAHRVHLYNEESCLEYLKNGRQCNDIYVHAVVEFEYDGKKRVADPTINVIYPYGIAELRKRPYLIKPYIPSSYDYELYSYRDPRGIRWSIFGGEKGGKFIYNTLVRWLGKEKTDNINYPILFERPSLLFSVLLFGVSTLYILVIFLIHFIRVKKGMEPINQFE
jgi:hypothetical protein